jgi:hypothetical protein
MVFLSPSINKVTVFFSEIEFNSSVDTPKSVSLATPE